MLGSDHFSLRLSSARFADFNTKHGLLRERNASIWLGPPRLCILPVSDGFLPPQILNVHSKLSTHRRLPANVGLSLSRISAVYTILCALRFLFPGLWLDVTSLLNSSA